jgi:hypothetical protein
LNWRRQLIGAAAGLTLLLAPVASAVPTLQLYIEGASWDPGTQTWVLTTSGTFNLWVIGTDYVQDVKVAAAVLTSEAQAGGTISLAPTTSGLMCGSVVCDQSGTPPAPIANGLSAPDAVPVMGNGSPLPRHGTYGPGTGHSFFEWRLGDFDAIGDPVGDFQGAFPTSFPDNGQINVYSVSVSGLTSIHFDAYDHIVDSRNRTKYVKAPFSHDAEATLEPAPEPVPEPSSLLLLAAGVNALVLRRRWR